MVNTELLDQIMAHTKTATEVLERNGYTFIYADEDEKQRRKELRAQGVTRKIKVVPWQRDSEVE